MNAGRRNRRAAFVIAAAIAVAAGLPRLAAAEDAGPVLQLSPADRKELDALLGKGVVGAAVPSAPIAAPEALLSAIASNLSYRVIEDGKATTEQHRLSPADPSQSAKGWQYAAGPDTTLIIEAAADGSLAVVAEYDREQDVISRFTPGEPLLIGGLKPGESRRVSMKVEVVDIDDPTDVEHRGTLDVTQTHLGTYRVTVPAGSFEAPLLKWAYKGEIGPASVETTQYRFIDEKTGMIAMIEWRNISALLVYHDKSRRGKLLEKTE
jgi:hypothetical protein